MVADAQTKGRGRGARKWASPKGGLWFSILLRPENASGKLQLLQFLAAIATRRALQSETGLLVQLKWPNDLVLNNAKLGGILVESKTLGGRVTFAVLGIGLNVNPAATELPVGATSLSLVSGRRHDLDLLLKAILHQIRSSLDDLDHPSKIMGEWWRNCAHRPFKVKVTNSENRVVGISRGIEEDGTLLIETDDHRIRKFSDGSLEILES